VPATPAWESGETPNEDEIPVLELSESLPEWSEPLHAAKEPESEPAPKEVAKAEPDAESEKQEAQSLESAAEHEPELKLEAQQKSETAPQKPEVESEPEPSVGWPPAFIPALSSRVDEARTPALQIVPAVHAATNGTDAAEPPATSSQIPLASPSANAASLGPADVEAAIQRVMERMQPQIIELVTRDILRPLVEALVQQELKK
jgi:hypothetical protein